MNKTSAELNLIILIATLFFFALIFLEIWYGKKKKLGLYSVKETLTSFSTGIVHRCITLMIPFAYKVYFLKLGESVAFYKLEKGFIHFIIAFLITDMFYYFQHRINHKLNFFWAFHEAHHNSQELNLMTAVRVSWIMPIFGAIFYTPVTMLGIHPDYVILSLVLIFYGQWWCHTKLIGKIPFIEGILNTPSAHRVHHSPSSGECNSNYAGFFIIWDRMFGTYVPEKEVITKFGINDGFVGHNPLIVNFRGSYHYWKRVFKKLSFKKLFLSLGVIVFIFLISLTYKFYYNIDLGEKVSAQELYNNNFNKKNYLSLSNPTHQFYSLKSANQMRYISHPDFFKAYENDHKAFGFNLLEYLNVYKVKNLKDAKFLAYKEMTFESIGQNKNNLAVWGELDHPLIEKLESNLSLYDSKIENQDFYESTFFNAAFQSELDLKTTTSLVKNKELKILENGDSFNKYLEIINKADKYLLIQTLAFACEEKSVLTIIEAIKQKIQNKTKVILLIDNLFGSLSFGCFEQFKNIGIEVVPVHTKRGKYKVAQHSSIFMNDQDQMLIGSQSIYWGFLEANGINFLDRDTSIYVNGASVTDAMKEFMNIYSKFNKDSKTSLNLAKIVNKKMENESEQKQRGQIHYGNWINNQEANLCRFAAQRPMGEKKDLENLFIEHAKLSEKSISLSSVKFMHDEKQTSSKILNLLAHKANNGVNIEFFGNGIIGGNGELTIEAKNQFSKVYKEENSFWEKLKLGFFKYLEDNSYENHLAINIESMKTLLKTKNMTFWMNSNFTHHKSWEFDKASFAITSSLFADRSFEKLYEAGIFCYDKKTQLEFQKGRLLDMANSIPFWKR